MDESLLHHSPGGGLSWQNLANNWVQYIPLQLWPGWGQESHSDWIKLPYYIYIKCLSTFWCIGWSYGCILTLSKPWRWTELAESGSQLGTKHTTTTTTWLWPRTTSDWITLPSYIYIKCSSTFQCSWWLYWYIITSSKPWRWTELAESGKTYHYNYDID
jgi:hypothetical protein